MKKKHKKDHRYKYYCYKRKLKNNCIVSKKNLFKIGFAAETGNLKENALKKLRNKKLDMIVANDVTEPNAGFGHDTNKISIIDTNENVKDYPLMSKYDAASKILDSMVNVLGK